MASITLTRLTEDDREQFILDNQEAFNYGALVEFGLRDDHFEEEGEIISRETIEQSIDGGEAYRIREDGMIVGGVVIKVEGDRGDLDLLFVSPRVHSKGVGHAAWCAVEKLHPEVTVWETVTPYFEKRNIHFYVNKCGFHIVEFFNKFHPDPNDPESAQELDDQFPEGMFRFEKRIGPAHGETNAVRAVIFDLDGTMTDTEKYFQRAWAEAMARSGFEPDREKTLALRSLGKPFVDEQLKAWFGESCRPEEIMALSHSIFASIAKENGVALKPGAEKLLAWLKARGIVIALATAGTAERAEKQLTETGVIGYFDKIISANMVAQGKPAPDTYLHACRELGVRPEEAIAVEDSPNGIKSAYAAGCRVIMVPDQTEPDEEIRPMLYACVSSLDRIIDAV